MWFKVFAQGLNTMNWIWGRTHNLMIMSQMFKPVCHVPHAGIHEKMHKQVCFTVPFLFYWVVLVLAFVLRDQKLEILSLWPNAKTCTECIIQLSSVL